MRATTTLMQLSKTTRATIAASVVLTKVQTITTPMLQLTTALVLSVRLKSLAAQARFGIRSPKPVRHSPIAQQI